MKFGEKLLLLRKEKNMSQEALADSLEVSRQAVSRWENDQGYPETDKLLQLGNLFGVSMDYLLKEEPAAEETGERGYYASREVVEAFLRSQKRDFRTVALAVFLFMTCGLPSILAPQREMVTGMLALVIIFAAIAMLVSRAMRPNKYKKLHTERLCFDTTFISNLREEYQGLRKRYNLLLLGGGGLILLALLSSLAIEEWVADSSSDAIHGVFLLLIAAAIFLFIFVGGMIGSYELLVNNEEHIAKSGNGKIWGDHDGSCHLYLCSCGAAAQQPWYRLRFRANGSAAIHFPHHRALNGSLVRIAFAKAIGRYAPAHLPGGTLSPRVPLCSPRGVRNDGHGTHHLKSHFGSL